jgi:S-formylglutathione hydrolase FrmB
VLKNRNGSLAKVPIVLIAALSFYYASAYARWQAHSTPFYGVFVTEQQFRDELPHIIAQGLAAKRGNHDNAPSSHDRHRDAARAVALA